MMRPLGNGLALAFQFFSVIPVKKELSMEKKDITAMYAALPFLGLLFGSAAALIVFLLKDYTDTGSLFAAFLVVLVSAVGTGGLHLDGLADVGDAYFSYRDREKRFEIMADPRIGAFGTMVLLFTVVGKIILISEIIYEIPLLVIVLIPFLSRTGLLVLFTTLDSAKNTGIAFFFQNKAHKQSLVAAAAIYMAIAFSCLVWAAGWQAAFLISFVFLLTLWLYRNWCKRNFGGATGDLFGAYIEGAEWLLWASLLFFI